MSKQDQRKKYRPDQWSEGSGEPKATGVPGKVSRVVRVAAYSAAAGSGAPLPDGLRSRFERSLDTDLSDVRLHTDGGAAEAASLVNARAYTLGNNIFFGANQYDPTGADGQHLLAHEVAHTAQQQRGNVHPQHKLTVSQRGDALEVEADRAADAMVKGAPAPDISPAFAGLLSRDPGHDDDLIDDADTSEVLGDGQAGDDGNTAPSIGPDDIPIPPGGVPIDQMPAGESRPAYTQGENQYYYYYLPTARGGTRVRLRDPRRRPSGRGYRPPDHRANVGPARRVRIDEEHLRRLEQVDPQEVERAQQRVDELREAYGDPEHMTGRQRTEYDRALRRLQDAQISPADQRRRGQQVRDELSAEHDGSLDDLTEEEQQRLRSARRDMNRAAERGGEIAADTFNRRVDGLGNGGQLVWPADDDSPGANHPDRIYFHEGPPSRLVWVECKGNTADLGAADFRGGDSLPSDEARERHGLTGDHEPRQRYQQMTAGHIIRTLGRGGSGLRDVILPRWVRPNGEVIENISLSQAIRLAEQDRRAGADAGGHPPIRFLVIRQPINDDGSFGAPEVSEVDVPHRREQVATDDSAESGTSGEPDASQHPHPTTADDADSGAQPDATSSADTAGGAEQPEVVDAPSDAELLARMRERENADATLPHGDDHVEVREHGAYGGGRGESRRIPQAGDSVDSDDMGRERVSGGRPVYRVATGDRLVLVFDDQVDPQIYSTDFHDCAALTLRGQMPDGRHILVFGHVMNDDEQGAWTRLQQEVAHMRELGVDGHIQAAVRLNGPNTDHVDHDQPVDAERQRRARDEGRTLFPDDPHIDGVDIHVLRTEPDGELEHTVASRDGMRVLRDNEDDSVAEHHFDAEDASETDPEHPHAPAEGSDTEAGDTPRPTHPPEQTGDSEDTTDTPRRTHPPEQTDDSEDTTDTPRRTHPPEQTGDSEDTTDTPRRTRPPEETGDSEEAESDTEPRHAPATAHTGRRLHAPRGTEVDVGNNGEVSVRRSDGQGREREAAVRASQHGGEVSVSSEHEGRERRLSASLEQRRNAEGEIVGQDAEVAAGAGPITGTVTGGYTFEVQPARENADGSFTVAWTVMARGGGGGSVQVPGLAGNGGVSGRGHTQRTGTQVFNTGTREENRAAAEAYRRDFESHAVREFSRAAGQELGTVGWWRRQPPGTARQVECGGSVTGSGGARIMGAFSAGVTGSLERSTTAQVTRGRGDRVTVVQTWMRGGAGGGNAGSFVGVSGDVHARETVRETYRVNLTEGEATLTRFLEREGYIEEGQPGVELQGRRTENTSGTTVGVNVMILGELSGTSDTGTRRDHHRNAQGEMVDETVHLGERGFTGNDVTGNYARRRLRVEAPEGDGPYQISESSHGTTGDESAAMLARTTGQGRAGGRARSSGNWSVTETLTQAEARQFHAALLARFPADGEGPGLGDPLRDVWNNLHGVELDNRARRAAAIVEFISEEGRLAIQLIRSLSGTSGATQYVRLYTSSGEDLSDVAGQGEGGDAQRVTTFLGQHRSQEIQRWIAEHQEGELSSTDVSDAQQRMAELDARITRIANVDNFTDMPPQLRADVLARYRGYRDQLAAICGRAGASLTENFSAEGQAAFRELQQLRDRVESMRDAASAAHDEVLAFRRRWGQESSERLAEGRLPDDVNARTNAMWSSAMLAYNNGVDGYEAARAEAARAAVEEGRRDEQSQRAAYRSETATLEQALAALETSRDQLRELADVYRPYRLGDPNQAHTGAVAETAAGTSGEGAAGTDSQRGASHHHRRRRRRRRRSSQESNEHPRHRSSGERRRGSGHGSQTGQGSQRDTGDGDHAEQPAERRQLVRLVVPSQSVVPLLDVHNATARNLPFDQELIPVAHGVQLMITRAVLPTVNMAWHERLRAQFGREVQPYAVDMMVAIDGDPNIASFVVSAPLPGCAQQIVLNRMDETFRVVVYDDAENPAAGSNE